MWRFVVLGLVIIGVVVFGFSLIDTSTGDEVNASALLSDVELDSSGFARAIDPYDWYFPADYGAHPDFQTEWWYYTGNLATESGRRFGFQFTIFRRALLPSSEDSGSEWRTRQVYMAHFTVSDIEGDQFYHQQRYSRGGAGLAGATADPRYHVWLEDWQIEALNDDAALTSIQASAEDFAVDLQLEQVKPPALQGVNGLSPKSGETGNASYYYSLPRLLTEGTVRVGDEQFTVSGATWMDHEFSTSALGMDAQGWDWFGLIFDNDREMMLGQIRLVGDDREPAFGGLLVNPDGSTQYLDSSMFTIEATDTWTSPHTSATYPSGWDITVNAPDETLNFTLTPLMGDQELHDGDIAYWEGAVRISGDVSGYGYAELTGYVDAMTGRF
ncbi:MAG: carotenoid 1,2-hydratase [Anaerolineae bacterium]|nr:carotenoid 1,2-hydratase [Anaerolineae bacterium]